MSESLYEILNIPETAPAGSVERAYRARLKSTHEDPGLSEEARRVEILAIEAAFRTLSDERARASYDARRQQAMDRAESESAPLASLSDPRIKTWMIVALVGVMLVVMLVGTVASKRSEARAREARELAVTELKEKNRLLIAQGLEPIPEVVIYTATWCGVCQSAKKWMRSNSIAYTEYDVENDERGRRDFRDFNVNGVPVIVVGSQRMVGFDPGQIREAMKATGS
jgi:glutaredoxin